MKITRYRLSLSVGSHPAADFSMGQWPRGRTSFLDSFQPKAQRYRRRKRLGLYLFLGFMLGGFALTYLNLRNSIMFAGFILLMATWFGGVITFVFGLKLRCPACRKRLEPAKGVYCPQCGSDQYQRGAHRHRASYADYSYCPACQTRIAEDDGDSARSYRIRGCTHCGVLLDESGV